MKLADAIALAGGVNTHPIPQPCLIFVKITQGKHAYDSCYHCAGGKCDRCKAQGCTDRDWRLKGRDPP